MVLIWSTVVICGLATTIGSLLYAKKLRSSLLKSLSTDNRASVNELNELDEGISNVLVELEKMFPYENYMEIQDAVKKVQHDLSLEVHQVKNLEKELEQHQRNIEDREKRHNQLKQGKGDTERLVDEIRASQEQLTSESSLLQSRLHESQAQLDALAQEVTMTDDCQTHIDKIMATLKHSSERLDTLVRDRQNSVDRYGTLQKQYSELELEFRRLIERELVNPSG